MKRSYLITVCLFAAIIIVAVGTYARRQREPVYQGKKLSEWLQDRDWGTWPRRGTLSPADEALQNMGSNALPTILRLLHPGSSAPKAKLVAFLNKQQIKGFHITTDNERYHRAIAACFALGRDAEPVVPAMAKALVYMDPGCLAFASHWLGSMGDAARTATPALIKMLQNTNDLARYFAAQNLAHICGERRDEVVTALKECVRDTNQSVHMECTRALELLGEILPGNESLRQKAEAGDAEAQLQLAKRVYEITPRLSANYIEAYKWAAIAASHDNRTAKYLARELEIFMTAKEMTDARLAAESFVESRKGTEH